MNSVLCATKINCVGNKLYFLTDEESVMGRISSETGQVEFLENVPDEISGLSSHSSVMVSINNKIYIVANAGSDLIVFDTDVSEFAVIHFELDVKPKGGWAGAIVIADKIYVFARENGLVLVYDTSNYTYKKKILDISEKIMWVCKQNGNVAILTWNCKKIYFIDLKTMNKKEQDIKLGELKSKSFIPAHSINCDGEYIYILDAKNIYRFDMISSVVSVLYEHIDVDNGSRMIILDNTIIIPPFSNNRFILIDAKTGKINSIEELPRDIEIASFWKGSKTGLPCENDKFVFMPIVDSNMILCIEKRTLLFKWIQLEFENDSKKRIVSKIIKKNAIVKEDSFITLKDFIDGINMQGEEDNKHG